MEMNFKDALEFGLACFGALCIVFSIFGVILYRLLIMNHVRKEQEEEQDEERERHFIDELKEQ